jgi:hypothetical protein
VFLGWPTVQSILPIMIYVLYSDVSFQKSSDAGNASNGPSNASIANLQVNVSHLLLFFLPLSCFTVPEGSYHLCHSIFFHAVLNRHWQSSDLLNIEIPGYICLSSKRKWNRVLFLWILWWNMEGRGIWWRGGENKILTNRFSVYWFTSCFSIFLGLVGFVQLEVSFSVFVPLRFLGCMIYFLLFELSTFHVHLSTLTLMTKFTLPTAERSRILRYRTAPSRVRPRHSSH